MILRSEKGWRALQNIGGMGNVTFVPPTNSIHDVPLAFDTGCGNVFIDYASQLATNGVQSFDVGGELARKGRVNEKLLEEMKCLDFFKKSPPKTTGREHKREAVITKFVLELSGNYHCKYFSVLILFLGVEEGKDREILIVVNKPLAPVIVDGKVIG